MASVLIPIGQRPFYRASANPLSRLRRFPEGELSAEITPNMHLFFRNLLIPCEIRTKLPLFRMKFSILANRAKSRCTFGAISIGIHITEPIVIGVLALIPTPAPYRSKLPKHFWRQSPPAHFMEWRTDELLPLKIPADVPIRASTPLQSRPRNTAARAERGLER